MSHPSLSHYSSIYSFHPSTLPPATSAPFYFPFSSLLYFPLITSHPLPPTSCLLTLTLPLLLLQVRLLYCSLEEAELVFRAAWAAGQAGPSHMWFAVGPALSGLGLEGLPKALFAIRPQGWRDEPRRYEQFFTAQFHNSQQFASMGLTICSAYDTLCPQTPNLAKGPPTHTHSQIKAFNRGLTNGYETNRVTVPQHIVYRATMSQKWWRSGMSVRSHNTTFTQENSFYVGFETPLMFFLT